MTHSRAAARAFTLVELLVVIGIIAILITITLGVAGAVVDGGRKRATEGALRALDQTLDLYIDAKGEIPPALVEVPPNRLVGGGPLAGQSLFFPLFDGLGKGNGSEFSLINSVGLYLVAARDVTGIQDIIAGLDQKFVQTVRSSGQPDQGQAQSTQAQIELLSVLDGWGNPIRMVHPRFDGVVKGSGDLGTVNLLLRGDNSDGYFAPTELPPLANRYLAFRQVRRVAPDRETWRSYSAEDIAENFVGGVGDADGGICPSPRPYFYSCGPDGDPATIEDNVYTTTPRFSGQAG